MASAVAISDGITPNDPSRRTRAPETSRAAPPSMLRSVTIVPSRSAMSSKSTFSSTSWLSVSWTIAIEPTRRTASSSAAFASGESIRRAWSRSRAATVWRLFFTRWWISRIVASLVTSSRSRRRRSVTSRTSTSAPMCSPSGRSGIDLTISATEVGGQLGVAVGAAGEHSAERLLVGAQAWRDQVAGQVGEQHAGQVPGQPEAAVHRERVRACVDHPALRRRPGGSRPPPAVSPRGRCAGRVTGSDRGRSSGSGRQRSGGRTAPAGWVCGRRAGWCCRPTTAMTRPARRTGMVSSRTGTSSRHSGSPSRTSRPSA